MEKKTIIIISLLSAIFSLIYVVLSYYGLTRYIGIYLFSTERYVKNYKKLDKIGNYKTVISLTATPNQMSKLSYVIKSLLDQTVRVDFISLIIPDEIDYNIPKDMDKSILVLRCGQDHGILNCLVPSILKETESTTRIITLGAGTIYGKDFIETLMEESEKYTDKIIYANDKDVIDLNKGVVFSTAFFKSDFVDIPQGVEGNKWVNEYFKDFPKQRITYGENYKTL
jgi:hypothetical protein